MKVLVVCHRFPFPPKRGGKIRPFNMIRHLHESGHEVHVASLTRSEVETSEIHGIKEHCTSYVWAQVNPLLAWVRMLTRAVLPTPSSMGYFYSRRLQKKVDELLEENAIDLIIVHCSSVAQYVENTSGIPKILDFGDMDSQKWRIYAKWKPFPLSIAYWWEGLKLERKEKQLAKKFDLCSATTKLELETLQSYGVADRTGWYPNGVDSVFFCPDDTDYDPNLITFIGRMDYFPNQQAMHFFCRDVLPLLQAENKELKLQIVGADPSKAIWQLAELPGVTVTGSVDDVRPFVRRGALTVAPLAIARGTQNKILESMAMGVPVVCSPAAAGGVDALPGEHIVVCDSPEAYKTRIIGLVNDTSKRAQQSEAGRECALHRHNWSSSMQQFDQLIELVMQ